MINYTPFGFSDWQTEVSKIKAFGSAGKKTAVVSTINGDANVPFYKELGNQGIKATDIPVVAFSVGEEELAGLDTKPLVGHLAAWNYFEVDQDAGQRRLHQGVARLHQEPEAHHQRSDGSALHRLQHVGEGGREGRNHRSRQGDRRAARHAGAEPHRRRLDVAAEPPHHQAGLHRRNPARRPVQRGVEDQGLVPGDAWSPYLPGSKDLDGRLGEAQVRQLQQGDAEMRRRVRSGRRRSVRNIAGRRQAPPSRMQCRGFSRCVFAELASSRCCWPSASP